MITPKRIVIATIGSLGDLHPCLALGQELRRRGHRVTIASTEYYRSKVEELGIEFHSIRPNWDPTDRELIRQCEDLRRGPEVLYRKLILPELRATYDDLTSVATQLVAAALFLVSLDCRYLPADCLSQMSRLLLIIFALGCNSIHGNGQTEKAQGCSVQSEFAPVLVSNPNSVVTFKCDRATALQLIEATGRQTRGPIGIVLGEDPTLLSKTRRTYNLEQVDTRSALLEAIAGTGYSLKASNGVFVLIAGDLTSRQQQVLDHEYPDFKSEPHQTMVELGVQLTMWMLTEIDGVTGFAGSILGATNDERFTFGAMAPSTTEEIANRIVSLGSKGMWILTMNPFDRTGERTDGVEIKPYQHYSNLPNTDR
jgi:hypothetical protein